MTLSRPFYRGENLIKKFISKHFTPLDYFEILSKKTYGQNDEALKKRQLMGKNRHIMIER